jgi:hypothetical protein
MNVERLIIAASPSNAESHYSSAPNVIKLSGLILKISNLPLRE